MPAANEYRFGVTIYSSLEVTRNIINLFCHCLPNSIKLCYKKRKSIKKQTKKLTRQIDPGMSLLLWFCLYS
ncbi:hypothetical protein BCV72DRAFT_225199 [Rhizopus microsporus var. microsporus]|uniref:Uncharacterized protein n=2 Tax=Rhizopus microsporus TaxID=58291 RepID=A0A2G4SHV7_RHIZD|nr:uncharacterized protein RHIMIDRAFT_269060 [Rhizopus microsporus ATCC 52813]ORE08289.1 hypothetical protein BCV72DRAFT_225199 [Rhizopus microsporus var. microsporus]PHZ08341.1 hypothetical protein RHIMIDRAFT_269060 [Rhizopus microsporus ATCC 52813]